VEDVETTRRPTPVRPEPRQRALRLLLSLQARPGQQGRWPDSHAPCGGADRERSIDRGYTACPAVGHSQCLVEKAIPRTSRTCASSRTGSWKLVGCRRLEHFLGMRLPRRSRLDDSSLNPAKDSASTSNNLAPYGYQRPSDPHEYLRKTGARELEPPQCRSRARGVPVARHFRAERTPEWRRDSRRLTPPDIIVRGTY